MFCESNLFPVSIPCGEAVATATISSEEPEAAQEKSFWTLRRSASRTFLPRSAVWQCLSDGRRRAQGDPQQLITDSCAGERWAGRVRDSANQHVSGSLQLDTPASPRVFFP